MNARAYKAGIRFNGDVLKYVRMEFDGPKMMCTMYVDIVQDGVLTTLAAIIPANQWVPVENENAPTRATKTTAKKAVKESK